MTAGRLDALAVRATVRIGPDTAPGTLWGSGFFVAPGWVLTCAHILPLDKGPENVGTLRVHGHQLTARARLGYWLGGGADPEQDLALVRLLEDPPDAPHACVRLTDRYDPPHRITAFGWRIPPNGEPQRWSGHSECNGRDGSYGLTLAPQMEIPHGASGGPLLDREHGVVAGVVKARRAQKDGGLAVSATALRGFREARPVGGENGLGSDPYAALIREHDRWHQRVAGSQSWVRAQDETRDGGLRNWVPRDSAEASALLAALPRPESSAGLRRLIARVLGYEPLWEDETAPVDWRDGQGWLYDTPDDVDIRSLHYLRAVARANACAAAGELERWVERRAGRLPDHLRALLIEKDMSEYAPHCHRPPVSTPRPLASDNGEHPVVAVELEPDVFRPRDRFHWRVWSWYGGADTAQVLDQDTDGEGVSRTELPYVLNAPLSRAFGLLDAGERRARLELALPVEHFDMDAHAWGPVVRRIRPHAADRPFGVHRQVVLRSSKRRGEPADVWRERWSGVLDGSLKALPVHSPVYAKEALDTAPPGTVPVMCRTPAESVDSLAEAIGAGYGVALWSLTAEHAYGCGEPCDELHTRAAELLSGAEGATALPEALRVLRERVSLADQGAEWAEHLALLYDDPRRPIPHYDDLLDSPS
ncbi:VMAP-C domain-containing protein [Streptomyces sp. 2A115]|uniref:VMAP-C domain-containing protein n=1 Tax=Streptomyces sp. 2A115 TaxID=3457439 RepID=UPI003FD477C1